MHGDQLHPRGHGADSGKPLNARAVGESLSLPRLHVTREIKLRRQPPRDNPPWVLHHRSFTASRRCRRYPADHGAQAARDPHLDVADMAPWRFAVRRGARFEPPLPDANGRKRPSVDSVRHVLAKDRCDLGHRHQLVCQLSHPYRAEARLATVARIVAERLTRIRTYVRCVSTRSQSLNICPNALGSFSAASTARLDWTTGLNFFEWAAEQHARRRR